MAERGCERQSFRSELRVVAAVVLGLGGCHVTPSPKLGAVPADYRLVYQQDFEDERTIDELVASDPAAWRLGGDGKDRWLEQHAQSVYRPPHRSPMNIAIVRSPAVADFVLEVDLQQTGRDYDHRDMCVFFSVQSPTRFHYAHLATTRDDTAHHVHLVHDAPRTPMTTTRSTGVDWGRDEWHTVRVERDATSGWIRVYFDDPTQPVLSARDPTLTTGLIGFGSFDDEGRIDDIRVWAPEVLAERPPPDGFEPLAISH